MDALTAHWDVLVEAHAFDAYGPDGVRDEDREVFVSGSGETWTVVDGEAPDAYDDVTGDLVAPSGLGLPLGLYGGSMLHEDDDS